MPRPLLSLEKRLRCAHPLNTKFNLTFIRREKHFIPVRNRSPIPLTSNLRHSYNTMYTPFHTIIIIIIIIGPGLFSRYSDLQRTGRSGDRIPVGARFFTTVQTGPRAQPASYTMGTGSFSGVKRPGRGDDHPPHLAPRLNKE